MRGRIAAERLSSDTGPGDPGDEIFRLRGDSEAAVRSGRREPAVQTAHQREKRARRADSPPALSP